MRNALIPAGLALVVALLWAPILELPFTGEDFIILGRMNLGEPGSPHVFRPANDGWLWFLHELFGVSSAAPYHAASLFLHLFATLLLFIAAAELLESRSAAFVAAALFGLGAGCLDSLVWIAAVNRLLSGVGALIALVGVLQVRARGAPALGLVVVGLALQLLSNEEVYGMALFVLAALGWELRASDVTRAVKRSRLLVCGTLVVAALVLRHFGLEQREGVPIPAFDAGSVAHSVGVRANAIAAGLGLPAALGLWLPLAAVLVLVVRRRLRIATLGAALWIASFVPFALSEPSRYRFYPTLAPTALLVAGALFALVPARRPRLEVGIALTVTLLAAIGSHFPRSERVSTWSAALSELREVAVAAREIAAREDEAPVLVNLELSSVGPFFYHFGLLLPSDVRVRHFLDSQQCYEEPGTRVEAIWWGRRLEGSLGYIEPESYFERPRIAPFRLYDRALRVESLDEAHARLRDPAVDLRTTALLEAPSDVVDRLTGAGEEPATLEVVKPFEGATRSGKMRIRVRSDHDVLFAYQEHWAFDFLYHLSPDQAVIVDKAERRRIGLTATDAATGAELPTYYVNTYGLGVVVPPGEHELVLDFAIRRESRDEDG